MQHWDTTLKLLIAESADRVLPMMGAPAGVRRWLNVELPKTQNLSVDLLAELKSGQLLHIELQSTNLARLPSRMLEYSVAIHRRLGSFPYQMLIYVGNDPLRMKNRLHAARLSFAFEIIDLKTLDGTALLESENISDNLLALLMALKDKAGAIRRIVGRINRLDELKRKDAVARLLLTCGLRKFGNIVVAEIERMSEKSIVLPLLKEDALFSRLFEESEAKVRKDALKEGRTEGRDLGKRELLALQLKRKFGALPAWANKRLSTCSDKQIDELAISILDCPTLDQLFGRK